MTDSVTATTSWVRCNDLAGRGPLVSVLLPTYNRRRYLAGALASVLRQTHRNLEVFVVRDGGEEVADIMRTFNDPRVVFIDRKDNRGKPYSLNEALSRANGKYIAYLDDDDVYYPNHVEALVRALETRTDCQVAYSDLYRVYCKASPQSERAVLSKYVEISRDFDRYLMLYFNHVLHVSLMHRRDLLDKTGPYTENLNILIDWDMTRRLAFFSDFHHVLAVTGEFYCPINQSDRISDRQRRDTQEYLRNILTIRTTLPSKPWPKLGELSIILAVDHLTKETADTVMRIWRYTFYPYHIYIPLAQADVPRLNVEMPNVVLVTVPPASSVSQRVDAALQRVDGEYVAVVPGGFPIEELWVEDPLFALLHSSARREAFLLSGASEQKWGAVLRREALQLARSSHPHLSVQASLAAGGIAIRSPRPEELPFQFDELVRQAKLAEADGNWSLAARAFEHAADLYHNEVWMKTMAARAHYEAGDRERAGWLSSQINRIRPTIDTLLLEAKVCSRRRDFAGAIRLLNHAEQWLAGRMDAPAGRTEEPSSHEHFPAWSIGPR